MVSVPLNVLSAVVETTISVSIPCRIGCDNSTLSCAKDKLDKKNKKRKSLFFKDDV